MSAVVKLSSKLPGDPEVNGLDAWAEYLCRPSKDLLIAVVYIDSPKSVNDHEAGMEVPTARIRRIEPLGVIGDVSDAVKAAVAAAEEERTGRKPLPFETVEVGEHRYSDAMSDED